MIVTKDLELRLVVEFPDIFRDYGGDMRTTCMHWGFSHDDGWFSLVRAYCQKLEAVRRATGIATVARQVKEKWGALVFYQDRYYPAEMPDVEKKHWEGILDDLENQLSDESHSTCEVCGERGAARQKGHWHKTVCPPDAALLGFSDPDQGEAEPHSP